MGVRSVDLVLGLGDEHVNGKPERSRLVKLSLDIGGDASVLGANAEVCFGLDLGIVERGDTSQQTSE